MANALMLENIKISHTNKKNIVWYVTIFALIFIASIELINTAWIADDAAITLRSVLNFINGYGPNFNIDERVQSYTHPLWFLLLSAVSFIFNNIFMGAYFLSVTTSLGVLILLLINRSTHKWAGVAAVSLLLLSKAYVDFSTSGLENPLSHLIIVFSIIIGLSLGDIEKRSRLLIFLLVSSSIYLNRPDLILLIAPWCSLILFMHYKKSLNFIILLGILPSLAWTIFSLIYYGMPFPNTAYAKLNINIPLVERIFYGLRYVLDLFLHDPITACAIMLGVILGAFGSSKMKALSIGIILYLFYVISIGGDYMAGRFLTPLFLVAVLIITFFNFNKTHVISVIFLILIGGLNIHHTLLSDSSYHGDGIDKWGIADERGYYYQQYGLLPLLKKGGMLAQPAWSQNAHVTDVAVVRAGLGFGSLSVGPSVHMLDLIGLSDPLLSRLPPIEKNVWRAGHLVRQLPLGYKESLLANDNQLHDEILFAYYNTIRQITRGRIFSFDRVKAVLLFNLTKAPNFNYYSVLSDTLTPTTPIKYEAIPKNVIETGSLMNENDILFQEWVIVEVVLPTKMSIHNIDLSLNDQQEFLLTYAADNQFLPLATLNNTPIKKPFSFTNLTALNLNDSKKMIHYSLAFENAPILTDRIRIIPIGKGDGLYGLGHLQVK